MDKKRKHNRFVVAGMAAAFVAAFASPASATNHAQDQTVSATLAPAISLSLSQPSVTFATFAVGSNSQAAGNLTVDTNLTTFLVNVKASSLTMTDGGTNSLALPLRVAASGNGLPGTPIAVGTSDAPLAAGMSVAGLGSKVFGLTLSQEVGLTDKPATYGTTLTYTGSATI